MVIYRFTGRAEAFKGCGMLLIDPLVDSSLTRLKKTAAKWIRQNNKSGIAYHVWIEKIWVKVPSLTDLIEIITTEDTTLLIEKTERIKGWFSPKQVKE